MCLNIVLVVCILAGFLLNVMDYERLSNVNIGPEKFAATFDKAIRLRETNQLS